MENEFTVIGNEVCETPFIEVSKIQNLVPVKFDGVDYVYRVCTPDDAEYWAIRDQDDNWIFFVKGCEGTDLIVDMI